MDQQAPEPAPAPAPAPEPACPVPTDSGISDAAAQPSPTSRAKREAPPQPATPKPRSSGKKKTPKRSPVRVRSKKTWSTVTNATIEVPEDVKAAVEAFRPPEGFRSSGGAEQSFMYSWGVYCLKAVPEGPDDPAPRFYCLGSAKCRTAKHAIPCRNGDRSNVNKHLKSDHCISSERRVSSQGKGAERVEEDGCGTAADFARPHFFDADERERALELRYMRLAVKKLLAFDFAEDKEFRILQHVHGDAKFPSLGVDRFKHLIVEMYSATKENIVRGLRKEVSAANLPILHFSMNLWTCKLSGGKYLGIRIFWVDRDFEMHDALVSIKPYCPDEDAAESVKAAMLWKIFEATVRDLGLKVTDFASCTTDNGLVMSMCANHAKYHGILSDWCISHLSNGASEQAFGISVDPAKSKNKGARNIVRLLIKVVERLNKSATWREQLEGMQLDDLGLCLKIDKHASQRWASLTIMMERILRLWHPLRELYARDGVAFLLDEGDNRDCFLQLYSLLQQVTSITRNAEHGSLPMNGEMHMTMSKLKIATLNESAPLKVFKLPPPPEEGAKANMQTVLESEMIAPENLTEVGRVTRREFCAALVSRYVGRVWDERAVDSSLLKDAAVMLTPPFHSGKHLDLLRLQECDRAAVRSDAGASVPTSHLTVEYRRTATWCEIRDRAIEAARKTEARRDTGDMYRDAKRAKLLPNVPDPVLSPNDDDAWGMFGDSTADGAVVEQDKIEKLVDDDIARFKDLRVKPADIPPRDALKYWGRTGKYTFRSLRPVAQQTYGNQAATAQIDRDLSGAGQLLAGRRSRMDSYYIEMMLLLHLNFGRIPAHVPSITARSLPSFLPKRFTGRDPELQAAEDYLDPILATKPVDLADDPDRIMSDED